MSDGEIGNKPEPQTQPPEHWPGGADAIDENGKYGDNGADGDAPGAPATRDLNPESNPAVEDETPDEISEPDDKQQEPDDDSDHEDKPHEPPA